LKWETCFASPGMVSFLRETVAVNQLLVAAGGHRK
jgi:hypothetical protein